MQPIQPSIKGRGAAHNLPNRFETVHIEPDPDACGIEEEQTPPQTVYLRDTSRTIIASNNSPESRRPTSPKRAPIGRRPR